MKRAIVKFNIVICATFYFTGNPVSSQTFPEITLSGYVKDDSDNSPLVGVNVFLNNTTLGGATDKKGFYYIPDVLLGTYEIVVSMIGYHMQKKSIRLAQPVDVKNNFRLKLRVLKLGEVEIVGIQPNNWQKNLKKFKKFFVGTSENASKCKILNPEVLDFKVSNMTGEFSAKAISWLKFENWALGYQILFYIIDFMANENGKMRYLLQTQFKELTPENEEMKQTWHKKRLQAYKGSIRHFLSSMVAGRLVEEGYEMYQTDYPYWNDINNTNFLQPVPADMIDTLSHFERKISFTDYLKIVYKNELEERNFYNYRLFWGSEVRKVLKQTSWINLPVGSVTVNSSGNRVGGLFNFETYGYWAWERFAEVLPLDYKPPDAAEKLEF